MKFGGRFSRKALTPSVKSALATDSFWRRASSASWASSPASQAWSKSCFVRPTASRRARRPLGGELRDPRLELGGRDHLGDEPPLERVGGGEPAVRRHPLERPREPEQPMDEPRAAGVRDEADPDEPGDEGRRVRRDPEVARAGEREARARRCAVDGGDDGLLERADEADVRVVRLLERLVDRAGDLAELLQVLAGAEPLAGARDDDAADRGVLRLVERLPQGGVEVAVERVVDLRPVERDREDGAVRLGEHLVGHGGSLTLTDASRGRP